MDYVNTPVLFITKCHPQTQVPSFGHSNLLSRVHGTTKELLLQSDVVTVATGTINTVTMTRVTLDSLIVIGSSRRLVCSDVEGYASCIVRGEIRETLWAMSFIRVFDPTQPSPRTTGGT